MQNTIKRKQDSFIDVGKFLEQLAQNSQTENLDETLNQLLEEHLKIVKMPVYATAITQSEEKIFATASTQIEDFSDPELEFNKPIFRKLLEDQMK